MVESASVGSTSLRLRHPVHRGPEALSAGAHLGCWHRTRARTGPRHGRAGAATWADDEGLALKVVELLSEPLGYAVWLAFGLAALPLVWAETGWREVLLGAGLQGRTVALIGWFGPRGLASVLFALIAVETVEVDDPLGARYGEARSRRGTSSPSELARASPVVRIGLRPRVSAAPP